ncbi:aminotransferase class V-fold PLP-dependent enzyme [Salinibacterium sp. ZJ77]|uniref:pyridoxal phosphate-dependent decarboxylase family protein n=1 Tax=Salinibacterium sp. ZJ77 TaxID=2708337 RepID=UPI001424377E|nr:aminotransferase class V-fold PLP-dependent enzyme [Salinibacterium sp. ZJ77]
MIGPRSRDDVLARLAELRTLDPPTHGGRVLSYVYDPDTAELDELAAAAIRAVQPLNGLDPTTFRSVAVLESELVGFARQMLHGDDDAVGSVTTGGTESCLLAVKAARDAWRAAHPEGRARLVAPATVHAAFHKAAEYFGVILDLVPTAPDGTVAAADVVACLGDDVALVVLSAPSYPTGALDPIAEVAVETVARGIRLHVDACFGGFVLPFWEEAGGDPLPLWDFRVDGVTSISADAHKYGYAPKGASVLLHRSRAHQRRQFFATTRWPGYPVVNPTLLGSKSAAPLAAAWALATHLGHAGFVELTARCVRATRELRAAIDRIEGLVVVGDPVGPLLAIAADAARPPEQQVDPHHWADAVRGQGFVLQLQPATRPETGVRIPSTTHLTITPVTERVLPDLVAALEAGADAVRGVPHVDAAPLLAGLPTLAASASALDPETAWGLLQGFGIGGDGGLPEQQAPLLALIEALPAELAERLLVEVIARVAEPAAAR